MAAGLCGLMAAGLIAGCGGSDGGKSDAKMKVGVVQIVQHPALDESNKGFVDALNEQGLKDKVDIDQQNAQGDQSNLRSIANRFVSGNYNLICAISTPAAQTMANATDKIPIICTAIADFENAKLMKSEKRRTAISQGLTTEVRWISRWHSFMRSSRMQRKSVSFTIPVKSTPSFRLIV